jgi:hypothetical protein
MDYAIDYEFIVSHPVEHNVGRNNPGSNPLGNIWTFDAD